MNDNGRSKSRRIMGIAIFIAVISLIVMNIGTSFDSLIRVLDYFAKKYSKLEEPKYQSISQSFLQIIRELRRKKPLYPKNLFRFDLE